ncbi:MULTISPECIES: hypothetical protein [Pseudomonas]|jgi:hypothetical protein|nr:MULTISPECIES: hypothetical protein [Pseudomonas]KPX59708.1 hypothetical protein ALO39_101587 [Pseudomonas syringae pv. lapsa]RMN72924.1 hypothetical protein ALQ56_101957 [Pseudomonas syringae pv. papulans]KPB30642.1 Unknown protein sequence [Pseudomonas syringae pv. syringae]MCK9747614.1 hypothetical protein [Pseudomonas syringae pv. syringae]MCL6309315.1 hypothetical protein [Pseudomonas syringae]
MMIPLPAEWPFSGLINRYSVFQVGAVKRQGSVEKSMKSWRPLSGQVFL